MALKHSRSLLWRGEDLGAGAGSVKQRIYSADIAATAPAQVCSLSFAGSTNAIAALLGTTYTPNLTGLNRLVVNQNLRYFMTLSCLLAPNSQLIQFPIAPLQAIFLPANVIGTGATLTSDSPFPLILPVGVSGSYNFIAGSTIPLTFDFVGET